MEVIRLKVSVTLKKRLPRREKKRVKASLRCRIHWELQKRSASEWEETKHVSVQGRFIPKHEDFRTVAHNANTVRVWHKKREARLRQQGEQNK